MQLDDKAVIPVLLYLFRRIEQRLDGSPTLVLLDEAWSYLQHGLFRNRLRDWLKTMRRKNAVVVMATQQISDIANSDIADVVLENCPTKILLPNAESKNPGSRAFFERLGLNERELDILQVSVPKQHYYVVSKLGRRLVDLGVGKVALAWVGVNGREERQIAETVMEQFGANTPRWSLARPTRKSGRDSDLCTTSLRTLRIGSPLRLEEGIYGTRRCPAGARVFYLGPGGCFLPG
jgi:type IV secretion system protein VirB4